MIDYNLTEMVDELRSGGKRPPEWLKAAVVVSLIASIYLFGMMHGIQLGAAAQALGYVNIPPTFVELPGPIAGADRFAPTTTMFDILDRVRYTTMAFAAIALSGIMGWILHTRLP
jgi:hypothetical protein